MNYFDLKEKLEKEKDIEFEEFLKKIKIRDVELVEIICINEIKEIKVSSANKTMLNAKETAKILQTSYQTLDRQRKKYESIPFFQEKMGKEVSYNIKHIAMYLYVIHNINCNFAKLFKDYFAKLEVERFTKSKNRSKK